MTFSTLDSALVGPLFATAEMRAVFSDESRLAAMLEAETALARAQARLGLASPALAEALAAIDPAGLDAAAIGAATALAGVPTIPFVTAVGARLPPELDASFHKGATTQDILDTALVLQARQGLQLVRRDLDAILGGLLALALTHRTTPMAGRTYGQQAAPLSFGYKVAVWAAGIADAAEQLGGLQAQAIRASLGGPVGTLAFFGEKGPTLADAFAEELGLAPCHLAWHVRRAGVAGLGFGLASVIGSLAKMAGDVAHLASTEVAEVAEPYLPGRGGSSAMPHKRNPVSSTVILAAHAAAPGHVSTLLTATAALHERPPGAWHAEWHALPSLFGLASGALAEGRRLAEGLTADPAGMARNLEATRGLLFADAAAARLAPHLGRARAHGLIDELAARVRCGTNTLREELAATPEAANALSSAEIEAIFDPDPAVRAAGGWVDRIAAKVEEARESLKS